MSIAGERSMLEALAGDANVADIDRQELMLFGQFVGAWDVDVVYFGPDGSESSARAEWHFDWILERTAVQDVYIVPPRDDQRRFGAHPLVYGTTIRIYDPAIAAWRVAWSSPISGVQHVFVARERAGEIVLEGSDDDALINWIFSEISDDTFRWHSIASSDEGRTWKTTQEMLARRRDRDVERRRAED